MNFKEMEICSRQLNVHSSEIINKVTGFKILKDCIKDEKGKNNGGKKQFNDIMEAAKDASCVEEFKLYILYKKAKGNGLWKELAEPLNKEIDSLMEIVPKIVDEASDKKIDLKESDVHLELVRKYTGYLMWQANVLYESKYREVK